jgi:hypothetical protein
MESVTQIGFFHFGGDHDKPVDALLKELCKQREHLAGSLIVLPEGFSIGGGYFRGKGSKPNTDPGILRRLQYICGTFDVCFVADLIIRNPDVPQPDPPYSSAYLIDSR